MTAATTTKMLLNMCILKCSNKISNMAEKCTLELALTLFALCLALSYNALFTGNVQTTLLSLNQMHFIITVHSIFCYCICFKIWRKMINLYQCGQEETALCCHVIKLSMSSAFMFCSKMSADPVYFIHLND